MYILSGMQVFVCRTFQYFLAISLGFKPYSLLPITGISEQQNKCLPPSNSFICIVLPTYMIIIVKLLLCTVIPSKCRLQQHPKHKPCMLAKDG